MKRRDEDYAASLAKPSRFIKLFLSLPKWIKPESRSSKRLLLLRNNKKIGRKFLNRLKRFKLDVETK